MPDIFRTLVDQALAKTSDCDDESFTLRGLWKTNLLFQPSPNERVFDYSYLLAQTVGQGCCYCPADMILEKRLIGTDARGLLSQKYCVSIAALDSVYSIIPRQPAEVHELEGNSIEKAASRNAIILDEVRRLLGQMDTQNPSIVNVGVLGILVKSLSQTKYTVYATDMEQGLVGRSLHGVRVEPGAKTVEYVKTCDLAVITGMTLATDSLDEIVDVAKSNDTKLLMFAETGANFGDEYCRTIGVDVVVSEPFPFYIFQGKSRIEVYRRNL